MEIAFTVRESLLINGTLSNSEVWPDLKKEHLDSIEVADLNLMKKIWKTPTQICYL